MNKKIFFQVEESEINFCFHASFSLRLPRINFITILISWPSSYLLFCDVTMPRIVVITDVSGQTNNFFNDKTSQGEDFFFYETHLSNDTIDSVLRNREVVGFRNYQHPLVYKVNLARKMFDKILYVAEQ